MISCRKHYFGATVFDFYQEKVIMMVVCCIISIPVTKYRERGMGGIHVKMLNNEKFSVLTEDDHRRTTEESCCQGVLGWRIPLSLQSAEVLSGEIPCRKTCLENWAYLTLPCYCYPRYTQ